MVDVKDTVKQAVEVATPAAEAARNWFVAFVASHPKTAAVVMGVEAIAILVLWIKGHV